MSKVKIKIIFLGHIPYEINKEKIVRKKSDLFQIIGPIGTYNIVGNSDGPEWDFTDENIQKQLPKRDSEDVLLAITNVALQDRYYVRGYNDNKVCLTFNTMAEILKSDNIPLENLIFRILYFISLAYKLYGNRMPTIAEAKSFIHDEAKGCIFDFNGNKSEVIYSLNKPQICHSCIEKLTSNVENRIEKNLVARVQKELKQIKKEFYYRIASFIKRHPVLAIIISSLIAVLLGIIGSTIATILWETILKPWFS